MVALDDVALVPGERGGDAGRFDAFGHDGQPQVVPELDDAANDDRCILIGLHVHDE